MAKSLKERYGNLALITGASDGMGRAFAIELAKIGINLILVARRKELLEEFKKELNASYSVDVKLIVADLSNEDDRKIVLNALRKSKPGLLITAAGFGTSGSFVNIPVEHELNMIDVNCRAVVEQVHVIANVFKSSKLKGGVIIFGSLLSFQGVPRSANYAATKAFTQTLAEGLHLELKPLGIDVLSVAPGPINSGFAKRANMNMGKVGSPETVAKESLQALGKKMTVRPGFLSKFLEFSLTLPRSLRSRIIGIIMNNMTKHHEQLNYLAAHKLKNIIIDCDAWNIEMHATREWELSFKNFIFS